MRLESKKVIVTGGGSGIGRAICKLFTQQGASVVIADIDEDGMRQTVEQIQSEGGKCLAIHTDVASEKSVEELMGKSKQFLGGLDILVNDAAVFVFGAVDTVNLADWDKLKTNNPDIKI